MSQSEVASTAAWSSQVHRVYAAPSGEVHALRGVDAAFPAGLVTVVAGPSGSGKSSLLRLLAGLDRPTAGKVVVGGVDLSTLSPRDLRAVRRRHVGYVFQRPSHNLVPRLSAREHVVHALLQRDGIVTGEVDAVLDELGLRTKAGHRPHELSGGEQQRVAFAQALVGHPSVLVADEPTAELDSRSAAALLKAVESSSVGGTAVILSSHDPRVLDVADRILRLRDGSVESEQIRDAGGSGETLAVIDGSGRVQLPPHLLARFPQLRARIEPSGQGVWVGPP